MSNLKKAMERECYVEAGQRRPTVVSHDNIDFVIGIFGVIAILLVVACIPFLFLDLKKAAILILSAGVIGGLGFAMPSIEAWIARKLVQYPPWNVDDPFRVSSRSWVNGLNIDCDRFIFRYKDLPEDIQDKFKHLEPVSVQITTNIWTFPFKRLYTYSLKVGQSELYGTDMPVLPDSVISFIRYMEKEAALMRSMALELQKETESSATEALRKDIADFDHAVESITNNFSNLVISAGLENNEKS